MLLGSAISLSPPTNIVASVLRPPPLWVSLFAIGIAVLIGPLAWGNGPASPPGAIRSVFFIAKSENKNQVHYGIRLDEACAPIGEAPVFAYWRMLERGPLATEPLLSREVPAYGLASQRAERRRLGGHVALTLNALPRRPIVIDSEPGGAGCVAQATAAIGGVPASLSSVFVQLRWPFGVDYLLLAGRAIADGRFVREQVSR
jgi:hypothetical protein